MDMKYIEAIRSLSPNIKSILSQFPEQLQGEVREVTLRVQRPLSISTFTGVYFLQNGGGFTKTNPYSSFIVTKEEIQECIKCLTEYSLHSFKQEINSGFITIKGGHRAGVSGSCVYQENKILAINNISSINLRVARQINGVATELMHTLFDDGLNSVLIVGEPSSGKTTLIKDMARCFSNGTLKYNAKVSIVDERGELAAVYHGAPQHDVGVLTDVFDGYKKADGMMLAIRSMSPQVIILDEISDDEDALSIRQGLNAGVCVIATVHASSVDELYKKRNIVALLSEGGFKHIVLLNGKENPTSIKEILQPKELLLC